MGLCVLANWNLQLKPMREFSPSTGDSRAPRRSGSRLVARLCWLGAATAIGGSLVWLAVGNDVAAKRPADLWAAGVIFDRPTAALF